ncbi:unnamed protein product [Enterobius vermicularis]|uniref:ANK_REP_REGION domain-containing protein n=1 Tax=Enterobius vermicularis TaxID=51028 RepID=A0A0N4UZC8_ENTVE|nr:unnamed protein product [Enterobius vermicularis]
MNNTETLFNRLITACEIWDLDEVKAVVETGFNVDTADDDRVTALQIAAANGNIGIVEHLLDMGANIEADNQIGMTPLHHAAKNGHCNVVRILLQRGAVIDKLTLVVTSTIYYRLSYYGASALTLAASEGHTDVVQFLINLKLSVNPQEKRDTALCPTPIMAAVFRRHAHICVLLAQRGANLDDIIPRLDNLSAMSIAITCDARVMVGTLLELKSNPAFRTLGNRKPYELAKDLKRDEIFLLLENAQYLTTERRLRQRDIREMIFNRDETGLRNALRSELLQSFPEKCTPLMYAVLLGDLNMVKVVREETNDINAVEEVLGLTALINNEMVEYLLNNGADITQVSKDHFNALDYAFSLGSLDARTLCVMQLYVTSGSPVPVKLDFHGSASRSGMAKLFQKIGFGSSVNGENREKNQSETQHIENLLNICAKRDSAKLKTANQILRSTTCGKDRENIDEFHKRLQKIRSLAEHSSSTSLRTVTSPMIRYSKEKINTDDFDDGRSSPSRRSLNQYTFTFKDRRNSLKK